MVEEWDSFTEDVPGTFSSGHGVCMYVAHRVLDVSQQQQSVS